MAGLSAEEEVPLDLAIDDFMSIYGGGKAQKDTPVSLDMLYDYVKREMSYDTFLVIWLRKGKIPEGTELTDELKEQIADHYIGIMKANVERMRKGEKLQFHEDQREYAQSQKNNPKHTQYRQQVVNYHAEVFNGYSQHESATIHWVKNVIQNKGTVSVAIPHAVNIVDVKEYQGKYFFLMRDPFNIYNTEYTKGKTKQEGLSDVFWKRKKNRYLKDSRRDIVHGGFRGTSWVEAKDLCAMLESDPYAVSREMTVLPKELQVSQAKAKDNDDDDLEDGLFS